VLHRAPEIAREIEAPDANAAPVGSREPDEHPDRRRLSGSVGPEEAEDLTFLNLEGDVGHGFSGAESFGQAFGRKDDLSHAITLTVHRRLAYHSGMARSRVLLWHLPAAVGGLAFLLLAGAFTLALRGSLGEPIGAPPPPPDTAGRIPKARGERLLLVLGDSVARGTGDEDGRGFAGRLLPLLRRGGPVEVANLAVDGATSEDVRRLAESANVAALARSADLIVLSMGGNDLSRSLPRSSGAPVQVVEEVAKSRDRFAANLRFVLGRLREANATAPIAIVGLYNPFSGEKRAQIGSSVIARWNALVQETALSVPGVVLVPTFDLFQSGTENLAVDQFHPNGKGYTLIAERIYQGLPASLRATPQQAGQAGPK
jgi:lysophospholipase L1-like esterase